LNSIEEIENLLHKDILLCKTQICDYLNQRPNEALSFGKIIRGISKQNPNYALEILDQCYTDIEKAWVFDLYATAYQQKKNWFQAYKYWLKAIEINDGVPKFHYNKAISSYKINEISVFLSICHQWKENWAKFNDYQQNNLLSYLLKVDQKLFLDILLKNSTLELKDSGLLEVKWLIQLEDYSYAQKKGEELLKSKLLIKDKKGIHFELLKALEKQQNFPALKSESEIVVELYPQEKEGYSKLLKAALGLSDYKLYDETMEKIYSVFNSSNGLFLLYCDHLEKKGQQDTALELLKESIEKPYPFQLKQSLLVAYMKILLKRGNFSEFDVLSKTYKEYFDLRLFGFLYELNLQQGAYRNLLTIIKTILEIKPNSLEQILYKSELENRFLRLANSLGSPQLSFNQIFSDQDKTDFLETLKTALSAVNISRKFATLIDSNAIIENEYVNQFKDVINLLYDNSIHGQPNYINSYENLEDAIAVASLLRKAISEKTPFSLIRLGDGEGNFLPYHKSFTAEQSKDQFRIQQIWWKQTKFNDENVDEVVNLFRESLDNADILGIVPQRILFQNHNKLSIDNKDLHSVRGNLAVSTYIKKNISPSLKAYTSSKIHVDLESWNLYQYILQDTDELYVISCHHEIDLYIKNVLGIEKTHLIHIPSEKRYQGTFGYVEENNHFPDRYNEILEVLKSIRPGSVWLVAAGFLGKIYCDTIKKHGGIAIDVGAVIDLWAGHYTRKLFDLNPEQNGISYKYLQEVEINPIKHQLFSNFNRTKNWDEKSPISKTAIKFLISSHPRSGSTYCAQLFGKYGYQIGHEEIGRDGMSSWLHAVEDLNTPFFKYSLKSKCRISKYAIEPEFFIGIVRNPFDIIPSICVENTNNVSFNFRRFHILREFDYDLLEANSNFEMAVASYLYWIDIILKNDPIVILKLENIDTELNSFLAKNHLLNEVKKVDSENITHNHINRNTTQSKYMTAKPNIHISEYESLPENLKIKLKAFCKRYNYPDLIVLS